MDDINRYAAQLQRNMHTIKSLLVETGEEEYHWKKNKEKWSLLEIICHLVDEEKEDFRVRLQNVLETPDMRPPAIDPVGWVTSRDYQLQHFDTKLSEFISERKKSIEWLKTLQHKNWDQGYKYGDFGHVNGHFFINNWAAHDYLHIRQITRVHYDYLQSISTVNVSYAGKWVAS